MLRRSNGNKQHDPAIGPAGCNKNPASVENRGGVKCGTARRRETLLP
jgi:hypothetical protein